MHLPLVQNPQLSGHRHRHMRARGPSKAGSPWPTWPRKLFPHALLPVSRPQRRCGAASGGSPFTAVLVQWAGAAAPLSIPGLRANDRSSAPQAFLGPQAGNTGKTSSCRSTYQRSTAQRPQARISSVVPRSQASSTERCQLPLVQVETESQKED